MSDGIDLAGATVPCCNNCYYWRQTECHYDTPRLRLNQKHGDDIWTGVWPGIHLAQWCGKWREMECDCDDPNDPEPSGIERFQR